MTELILLDCCFLELNYNKLNYYLNCLLAGFAWRLLSHYNTTTNATTTLQQTIVLKVNFIHIYLSTCTQSNDDLILAIYNRDGY